MMHLAPSVNGHKSISRYQMTAREMATGMPAGKNSSVEAGDDKTVLACFEEGLRYRKPSRKIGHPLHDSFAEATCAPAEGSGVIGLALRRWRRQAEATEFRQPSAAMTRWRVSVLPSTPLPVP